MRTFKQIAYVYLLFVCGIHSGYAAEQAAICNLKSDVITESTAPVVIVGGGLTGLISAYELKKAGIPSLVLEASHRIGGRVETIYYSDNATAEAHMEEYWERTPNYTLLKDLKLPLMAFCPHPSVIIDKKVYPHNGQCGAGYFASVFTPAEYRSYKKWNDKTWSLYNQLHQTFFQGKDLPPNLKEFTRISFAEYVKRAHLPRKVSEWIRVVLEPEISIGWDHITALDGIDEMRIFLETPEGYGETNYHVEGGNNNYINALADTLPKGTIKTQARVTNISQDENNTLVEYVDKDGKKHVVKSRYTIVAVPLFAINKIKFNPALPKEKQQAMSTTRFASYIKIQFRVKRDAEKLWSNDHEDKLFTLMTDTDIGSIYNATNFEKQLSLQDDLIMTVLMHGKSASEWSKWSSDKVLKKTTARMDQLFPGFSKYITSSQVYMYPEAIAYWPLALGRSRFDQLAVLLRQPFNRIQIGGDTTEDSHSEGAAQAALRMSQALINTCS